MDTRYLMQDGAFIVSHHQDVQEIHDRNMRNRADPIRHDWGRPAYEIPVIVELQWFYEENRRDPTFEMKGERWRQLVRRKLADPEWKYLRCQPEGTPNFTGWRAISERKA